MSWLSDRFGGGGNFSNMLGGAIQLGATAAAGGLPAWGVAASALGGAALGESAARSTQQQNEANIAMAREMMQHEHRQAILQRKFQEEMSSTAISRSMADLKRAGLNPILAVAKPASTPAGAMGRAHAPTNLLNPTLSGISTARDVASTLSGIRLQQNQVKKVKQEVNKVWAEFKQLQEQAQLTRNQATKVLAEIVHVNMSTDEKIMHMQLLEERIKLAARQGKIAETKAGEILAWVREFFSSIGLGTRDMLR